MPFDPQSNAGNFENYTSFRRVRAAKITKIWSDTCVGVAPNDFSVTFDPAKKPTPYVGWYVIAYSDGYISFCPPESFESGYKAGWES